MRPSVRVSRVRRALVAAAGITLLTTAPATAHDELVGTTPSSAARVNTAPQQVVLRFAEPPSAIGSAVTVKDSTGKDWTSGGPTRSGSTVTVPLRKGAGPGSYSVAWRVVSDDGHPVSSTFTYTVAGGSASSPSSTVASPDPSASTDAVSQRPRSAQANRDSKVLTGILVVFLVIVLAGIAALLMRRERR